jgi:hypothetical protein
LKLDAVIKSVKHKAALIKITRYSWRVDKPDLSKISNETLYNIINQNYRIGATIWNGSTADAIRYTKITWELVWNSNHIVKWTSDSNGLKNLIDGSNLSNYDHEIASKILQDLQNALNWK